MPIENLIVCPICGSDVPRFAASWTYDCHGIPYRLVCSECFDIAMQKGYDGQCYSSADENIK